MAERGRNWTDDEICALLSIWAEDSIQRQLLGATRNSTVFRTIADKLKIMTGLERDERQCWEKIKSLKKKYKEAVDKLRRSGVGIESEDEPDDQEIFASFKWFHSIHAVMRTRAVVVPLALLDTSSIVNQTTNNNNSDFDLDSEVEKMIEENNGQRGLDEPEVVEPASNLSGYPFETTPPTPTGPPSSATVAPAVSMNEPVTPVISSRARHTSHIK